MGERLRSFQVASPNALLRIIQEASSGSKLAAEVFANLPPSVLMLPRIGVRRYASFIDQGRHQNVERYLMFMLSMHERMIGSEHQDTNNKF
jgi:hypothetical protein